MVEKYGDATPWTLRQTLLGIILTLVPWLLFVAVTSGFTSTPTPRARPLTPQQDATNAIVVFILSSVIEGAFLIAPIIFANRARRSNIPDADHPARLLGLRGFVVGGAIVWIGGFVILILLSDFLYQVILTTFHLSLQTNDEVLLAASKNAPYTTYATLVVAVFVAPICEEVFFRGFVFAGFLRRMPLAVAILLSALIFAMAHGDVGSFAVLFIIGVLLAILRWRTNSIWPGIILHAINNGIGALSILLLMRGAH